MPPQLEKNHVVPTAWQDEALARDGVSRAKVVKNSSADAGDIRDASSITGKDSDAGRDWGQEEKGTTEDEMARWHHRLDGHEFE